jgi:hypothetical protein
MTEVPTIIAGEPFDVLVKGLAAMRFKEQPNGLLRVTGDLEDDAMAAWTRAVERYAAEFIEPGDIDPLEVRHADAFVRLFDEVTEALAIRYTEVHGVDGAHA